MIRQDENNSRWHFYYQYYFTKGLINVIRHFQTIAYADSFTASNDVCTNATLLEYSCSFGDKRQKTLKSKICCDIPPDIMHQKWVYWWHFISKTNATRRPSGIDAVFWNNETVFHAETPLGSNKKFAPFRISNLLLWAHLVRCYYSSKLSRFYYHN